MNDIVALKQYLEANFQEDFTSGDTRKCVNAINAKAGTTPGPISKSKFIMWLCTGPIIKVHEVSGTVGHPLRASALGLLCFLNSGESTFDLGEPQNQALLGAWEQAELITTDQKNALLDASMRDVSFAEQAGFSPVSEQDIIEARAL